MKRIIINFIHRIVKPFLNDLTDRVNDINSLVLTNKDEIGYINNELDAMSEKTIYNINLELTELRRIIENNDKRIDFVKEEIKRKIKVKALQTPFNDDDECGVCDEFIRVNAEQQAKIDELRAIKIDELKQAIKEVGNTINLSDEKE